MRKFREWFTLSFTLVVVPIFAHTCWVCTFSCLSRERTVHYTIMLIPTVFLLYALVSNCYLVTFFFFSIISEKFEFTSHTQSRSFANITRSLSTWLLTCLTIILLLSRKNQAQKVKFLIRARCLWVSYCECQPILKGRNSTICLPHSACCGCKPKRDLNIARCLPHISCCGYEPKRDLNIARYLSHTSCYGCQPKRDLNIARCLSNMSCCGCQPKRDLNIARCLSHTLCCGCQPKMDLNLARCLPHMSSCGCQPKRDLNTARCLSHTSCCGCQPKRDLNIARCLPHICHAVDVNLKGTST